MLLDTKAKNRIMGKFISLQHRETQRNTNRTKVKYRETQIYEQ